MFNTMRAMSFFTELETRLLFSRKHEQTLILADMYSYFSAVPDTRVCGALVDLTPLYINIAGVHWPR